MRRPDEGKGKAKQPTPTKAELPKNWKEIELNQLFTEAQIRYIESAVKKTKGNLYDLIQLLKPWLTSPEMKEQLKKKGMLADYAVYAIPFFINKYFKK